MAVRANLRSEISLFSACRTSGALFKLQILESVLEAGEQTPRRVKILAVIEIGSIVTGYRFEEVEG